MTHFDGSLFIRNSDKAIMKSLFIRLLAAPVFLGVSLASSAFAETRTIGQGLLVAPVKLEFEDRTRSGTLKILNRGSEEATYRVSFAPLLPKDKGEDARDWVRYSPRRLKLGPNEHQTVRIVLRKPADLPAGEYTARLMIKAIPPAPKPDTEQPTDKIKIKLNIVYGVSIPINIKHDLK